jgi:hypothetical protein
VGSGAVSDLLQKKDSSEKRGEQPPKTFLGAEEDLCPAVRERACRGRGTESLVLGIMTWPFI